MSTQIQRRRGTTAEHSTFTGVEGELTVDTTKDTVVVHDGATTGGRPLLREDQANLPTSVTNGISVPSANNVALSTSGVQRINIEADGDINIDSGGVFYDATNNRLGIGTTSPNARLQINNPSVGVNAVFINAALNGTGEGLQINANTRTNADDATALLRVIDRTNSDAFRVNVNGKVGIGTTSPTNALHINGTAGQTSSRLRISSDEGSGFTIRSESSTETMLNVDLSESLLFGNGGSEVARWDGSGRLLVGTSSSLSVGRLLQVADTSSASGADFLRFTSASQGSAPSINLTRSRSDTLGTSTIVQSGDSLGYIQFRGANGTSYDAAAWITAEVDGTPGASGDMPGRLILSTTASGASSPTERMRITSEGKIFAGATNQPSNQFFFRSSFNNGDLFHVWSDNASFTGSTLLLSASRDTTNSTYNFLTCIRQGAAYALYIRDSGNVQNANNSYTGISDIKLKENIIDASSQWEDIKSLKVRNYNFKEETGHPTHRQIGLIAQEVETVCPGLVDEAPDRDFDGNDLGTFTKGVNYSVLYMKAVKALQEAMERIETLEAKVAALESA